MLTGERKHLSPSVLIRVIQIDGQLEQFTDDERPFGQLVLFQTDKRVVLGLNPESKAGNDGERVFEAYIVLYSLAVREERGRPCHRDKADLDGNAVIDKYTS